MSETFPKKWQKVIDSLPEFRDDAETLDVDALEDIIIKCEGNIYNVDKEMAADIKLQQAKELTKDLAAGYRDAIKVQRAKLNYALHLIEGKGTEIGGNSEPDGD